MTQLIERMASIELNSSMGDAMEIESILKDFEEGFRRLDTLKNFRAEYEQKNFLARWWDNDKLRDAQLDSAEVQASFSKTIGRLVLISVMQSKHLTQQQVLINEQQQQIGEQVNELEDHARQIENHQVVQDQQAKALEQVVADYIKVKGISDENIRRLAAMVLELDSAKAELLAATDKVAADAAEALQSVKEEAMGELSKLGESQAVFDERLMMLSTQFRTSADQFAASHQAVDERLNQAFHANQLAVEQTLERLSSSEAKLVPLAKRLSLSLAFGVIGMLSGMGALAWTLLR